MVTQALTEMNLAQRLAAARVDIGSLKADKTNKDQGYDYISADKILERCGDVLANLGISIIPSVVESTLTAVDRPNKGPRIDAVLKMSFEMTDGKTDYVSYWVGCGSDYVTPDKAIYKAITSGHKYFLMKLLNIGVGNEDSEHENEEPDKKQPETKKSSPTLQNTSQPEPQPAQPTELDLTKDYGFGMSLAMAVSERNSKDVPYGSLETDDLTHMVNAMEKLKHDKPAQFTEDHARKIASIKTILAFLNPTK
jgi:hypothetical protein